MSEREQMLQKIREYSFTMLDTGLYLDSHPKDAMALDHFHKAHEKYNKAVAEFENKYGALSIKNMHNNVQWTWINDPWPWEGADN